MMRRKSTAFHADKECRIVGMTTFKRQKRTNATQYGSKMVEVRRKQWVGEQQESAMG